MLVLPGHHHGRRQRHRAGRTALAPHIAGISYVAMLTAFYVDNGPHLPIGDRLPPLSFWLISALACAPVIMRALHRGRRHVMRSS
jgi:hypothetical protein